MPPEILVRIVSRQGRVHVSHYRVLRVKAHTGRLGSWIPEGLWQGLKTARLRQFNQDSCPDYGEYVLITTPEYYAVDLAFFRRKARVWGEAVVDPQVIDRWPPDALLPDRRLR